MSRNDTQARYDRENAVILSIKLNKKTDADILRNISQAQEKGETRQGFIKRCVRAAIVQNKPE